MEELDGGSCWEDLPYGSLVAEAGTRVDEFSASFKRGESGGALELPCRRDTDLGGTMAGAKEVFWEPLGRPSGSWG